MWILTSSLVYFRIPFVVILWRRQNMIKIVQVLCRNTSDRYSAQVLVTGTSKGFQIWGVAMEKSMHTKQDALKNKGCF